MQCYTQLHQEPLPNAMLLTIASRTSPTQWHKI